VLNNAALPQNPIFLGDFGILLQESLYGRALFPMYRFNSHSALSLNLPSLPQRLFALGIQLDEVGQPSA
jgi:hypothetical protein